METNNQKGIEFEKRCYKKLEELGFSKLSYTPNTDNGADIIGTYNGLKYVFQCKNHKKKQGNRCIQEIVAARRLYGANRCVAISNSGFTSSAIELAKVNICAAITSSDFFALDDFQPEKYAESFQQNTTVYNIDYDIFKIYEKARQAYKRTPKWNELDKHLRYRIVKEYKNYGSFLKEIGDEKYSIRPSDDEIKREYVRVKSIIGRVPSLKDMGEHSLLSPNSFRAYPFTRLQKELGDRPNIERGVTKEELTQEYFLLQKKLGHPPTVKEIDGLNKYRSSYYRRCWGSMDAFLDSIGKSRTEAGLPRVYTKEELICIYSLIKMLMAIVKEKKNYEINHTVLERLKFDGRSVISPTVISKKFGSWSMFVQCLSDKGIDESINKIIEEVSDNNYKSFIENIVNANE